MVRVSFDSATRDCANPRHKAPHGHRPRHPEPPARGRAHQPAPHADEHHTGGPANATGTPSLTPTVTPSVAPLVALDLNPIDKDVPDGRELITTEPPTYALHRWDGASLVSHYERAGDWEVLARFHAGLQPMIEGMFAERE